MDNSSSEDSSVSVKPHTLLKLMNHLVSRAPGSSNLQYYPSQSFDMSMKKASHNEFRNYGKMIRKNSWSCPTLAQDVANLDKRSAASAAFVQYYPRPPKSVNSFRASSSGLRSSSSCGGSLTNLLRAGLSFPGGCSETDPRGREGDNLKTDMKVPPISLPSGMDRLPLPLPFSPDLLWRYPNPFLAQPPPSPLETQVKSGLPGGLPSDPRTWGRDEVVQFLQYCEKEFDLEKIDLEKFAMNGKALCFLSKNDLAERCSGAGDVIHNILQMLLREASCFTPSSPLTPRPPGLMTPTSPSPFGTHWPLLNSSASETFPNLSHLISQTNSVTLSPAPSIDSTSGGSPKQEAGSVPPLYLPPHLQIPQNLTSGNSNGSSHSDSEDSMQDSHQRSPNGGPVTPTVSVSSSGVPAPRSPSQLPTSSSRNGSGDTAETNSESPTTNGRLLWDFLQQLLNDPGQRYTSYIQWKNKETGVFKIVDPAGLARLWGIQKNHLSMNYDKMSRALRYYYRVNILRKVQGERHCYQFLRNPSELKSIKNISLLRQQMEAQAAAQQLAAQQAAQAAVLSSCHRSPVKRESNSPPSLQSSDEPTDLSTNGTRQSVDREREEKERERLERERYYSQLMERYNIERSSPARERSEEREEPKSHFDYRHLIPQVSIKTESC